MNSYNSCLFSNFLLDSILTCSNASTLFSFQHEADALLKTGWWINQNISLRCKWNDIVCDTSGSITEIHVSMPLPKGSTLHNLNFSSLPNLRVLYLFNSSLQGGIPLQISHLSKLTSLFLFFNNLTGELPLELGNLTNLLELNLSNNMFTGTIPSTIGHLTNLKTLDLWYNPFNHRSFDQFKDSRSFPQPIRWIYSIRNREYEELDSVVFKQ